MSEDTDAWTLLADLRWPDGQPCPECKVQDARINFVYTRNLFRCGECRHEFQIFTGTALTDTKASVDAIVTAAKAFALTGGKRGCASAIARQSGLSYKSALVLSRKFQECVTSHKIVDLNAESVLRACLHSPPSQRWTGYWKRPPLSPE